MQGLIYPRLMIRAKSVLIVDLEEEANKNVRFYLVANKKKHLYGEPNSTLCKSITNRRFRLIRWKKVNPVAYWELFHFASCYLATEENLAGEEVDIEEEEEEEEVDIQEQVQDHFQAIQASPYSAMRNHCHHPPGSPACPPMGQSPACLPPGVPPASPSVPTSLPPFSSPVPEPVISSETAPPVASFHYGKLLWKDKFLNFLVHS
jgi:hypothetical protein